MKSHYRPKGCTLHQCNCDDMRQEEARYNKTKKEWEKQKESKKRGREKKEKETRGEMVINKRRKREKENKKNNNIVPDTAKRYD